jgi:hypothetical protein
MRPTRSAVVVAIAVAGAMAAGCGSAVPSALPAGTRARVDTLPPSTVPVAPSASRAATAAASEAAIRPSPDDLPPDAAVLVTGAEALLGQLGSFTWRTGGSDAPWLQGTRGSVPPDRPLQFGLSRDVPVDEWSVAYAAAGQQSPERLVALDPTGAPLEVVPPPAGRWTVVLRVRFGAGLGDAAWYWTLIVG